MLRWAIHHVGWFLIRCVVTLACCWTVSNVISEEGYRVAFKDLLVCAIALIILMRFWMPKVQDKKETKETTFTE